MNSKHLAFLVTGVASCIATQASAAPSAKFAATWTESPALMSVAVI